MQESSLSSQHLSSLAERVDTAAMQNRAIVKLSAELEHLSWEDAYTIQRLSMQRRFERGERLVGMKMGLTSKAKMLQVNVDSPIYGHLTSDMQRSSGDTLSMSEQIHPRVEPEIAFIVGDRPVKGPITAAQAWDYIDGVCAAIEVIDSRYERFEFTLPDVVADNASSTRFFLGDLVKKPDEIKELVGNLGMIMEIDGEVKQVGSSAAILEHPIRSFVALVEMLSALGEELAANSIVLAGAATAAEFVSAGQHVCLKTDGLGEVHLHVKP